MFSSSPWRPNIRTHADQHLMSYLKKNRLYVDYKGTEQIYPAIIRLLKF